MPVPALHTRQARGEDPPLLPEGGELQRQAPPDQAGQPIVFLDIFFGGLECVGHSFAYVAHFVILGDVWIRTQRAAVASRATNLATHLPIVSKQIFWLKTKEIPYRIIIKKSSSFSTETGYL